MNRDLWYTLWGVGLALAIQVLYNGINEYPNLSRGFWFGIVMEGFILAILILAKGEKITTEREKPREESKGRETEKPKKETKDEILELIRKIDRNKPILFKYFDFFRGEWFFPSVMFFILAVLLFFLLFVGFASAPERITIALSLLAFTVGYFSLIRQFGKEDIVNLNFKRLERCVEEDKKPFLKALIKMKAKHPKFDLEQIYNLNPSMFTPKKLLERLYE